MSTAQLEAPATLQEATINITQEIRVQAPIDITFNALLEQLGPQNQQPDGTPIPFKIEAWPGGRWFRDLGDNNGHFWGNVQAIKRNTLLEMSGPLFMSQPVFNNVQYRLTEENGETVIRFRHTAFGLLPEGLSSQVQFGWSHMHELARKRAEAAVA